MRIAGSGSPGIMLRVCPMSSPESAGRGKVSLPMYNLPEMRSLQLTYQPEAKDLGYPALA
jgi:hypothetical protein